MGPTPEPDHASCSPAPPPPTGPTPSAPGFPAVPWSRSYTAVPAPRVSLAHSYLSPPLDPRLTTRHLWPRPSRIGPAQTGGPKFTRLSGLQSGHSVHHLSFRVLHEV